MLKSNDGKVKIPEIVNQKSILSFADAFPYVPEEGKPNWFRHRQSLY